MNNQNVVLLGGSNSVMVNGLQKGLREGIIKYNQDENRTCNLEFYNFALGASDSLQKVFQIIKNKKVFQTTMLIVVELNLNEYGMFNDVKFDVKILDRNLEILFRILSNLNTRIVNILLPMQSLTKECENNLNKINNLIKNKIQTYNFNYIDMQKHYNKKKVNDFFSTNDRYHQLGSIMQILGKNIIKEIYYFKKTIQKNIVIPNFIIKSPLEIFNLSYNLEYKKLKNSILNENIYKLDNNTRLYFNNNLVGYHVIGIAVCNFFQEKNDYCFSSFILKNQTTKIVKGIKSSYYLFHSLEKEFIIDKSSFMQFNRENNSVTEPSVWVPKGEYINTANHCGISYFLLAKFNNIKESNLKNVATNYDFSYLIPPVEDYKNIIEEYNLRMKLVQTHSLQIETRLKFDSAKSRIQNHLSYKLGQVLITNSKSILGYIRMPFVLSYIKDKHKFEQKAYEEKIKKNPNLALPSLESYPDYQEALKEKECFTYKLGEAFIKASKNWYKGGGISNLSSKMYLG
ncbi:glycosyl transferase [Campylobacter jejuni]|uniref:glycosyl transferase n=1 Tax=Campylobacter jejuni TaxID=197 RepID=UPI002581DE67|nr:glycosyl transferase [Campylobacter jejuni]GML23898.1 hypothetical protein B10776_14610 [Campylobacter jejuni]